MIALFRRQPVVPAVSQAILPLGPGAPEAHPPEVGAGVSGRLAALARRIRFLIGYALNAESAHASQSAEIEQRIRSMIGEIASAQSRMKASAGEAAEVRQAAMSNLTVTGERIGNGLAELEAALDAKLGRIGQVVAVLERIGKSLELLSLNAAIQAAGAGEAGRAFSVVADHIRELAKNTVVNAKSASELLDFSDLQKQLEGFRQSATHSVAATESGTASAFGQIAQAMEDTLSALAGLGEHGRVISAMHGLAADTFDRQRQKLSWAARLALETERAAGRAGGQAGHLAVNLATRLAEVARRDGLAESDDFDRLADIRRRGVLRVAIEPDFKGLSFRLARDEPLRGLDVDYARAFAGWLGVRAEFVEHPWDQCTELLHVGRKPGEPVVDVVWSALPPNAAYQGVAFSESYTYLNYVLARRTGDERIAGANDLAGRVLGCINDPAAFAALEAAGFRWSRHERPEAGTIRLANLISFSDQGAIHDALAKGTVDAFAVDHPIFAWACYGKDSPWNGQIEILPEALSPTPWFYAVGVADLPSSGPLLAAINRFLGEFLPGRERRAIEERWQFGVLQGQGSYRDDGLRGAAELLAEGAPGTLAALS